MSQPNILIFMTDHQRGDTLRPDSPCKTPNLDRLRGRAVTFNNAFCSAPHCCPSRASFFTGLYPAEHGVWNNVDVDNALSRGLYDNVRCFSEDFQDNGYRLYFSGKWHLSHYESPEARGFELLHHPKQYATPANRPTTTGWSRYGQANTDDADAVRCNAQIIRPGYPRYQLYGTRETPGDDAQVVQAAVDKLHQLDHDAPFLMYVGPIGPHDPYYVPQAYLDLYQDVDIALPDNFDDAMQDKPALYRRTQARYNQLSRAEHLEALRHFYAYCSYEDALFGKLLDALEASGHTEDTLVLYCSDHGDYMGAHGLWAKGLPCFREAYDICAMIGGPGVVNPGREEAAFVSIADWAPTFLSLAGIEANRPMTGRSLVPFLKDKAPPDWRRDMFTQTNGNEIYGIQRAVWDQKWKYVYNAYAFDELYDLEADPGELHNLLDETPPEKSPYADIVAAQWRKLWDFARQTGDGLADPYIMTALMPFGPGILDS